VRWFLVATLVMGGRGIWAQAPVVRQPPVVKGAQAPQSSGENDDAVIAPAAGSNAGSTPTGGFPTIRVETRLVNVAVNVVDAKGSPVGGLGKDDFAVMEDGKAQKIAVFEKEASSPLSIVLAIDVSESVMTNERLEKEAAKHFVHALLREQDELDLMEFADEVREVVPFTSDKKRIASGVNELQRGDATALYDAVVLASERLAGTSGAGGRRRVIVLITDGGDTVKGSSFGQAMEQAQRAGALVYSIIIVPIDADAGRNTAGEHALIQMAEDTGGKYYYVVDPKDLEPAFAHVSDDLRTQYLLGYYAPKRGTDNSFRTIKVKMVDPEMKYDLRYRTGYFADGH
jgi:Ca-activated chloride channel family protein